jgi:phosphohistidine phosphatase
MKTLFLLRHAKSSHAIVELDDILRPLNKRGYTDAKLMATALKKLNPQPQQVITSPAIRAYTTALIFASHLKLEDAAITLEPKLFFKGKGTILKMIKSLDDVYESIMLVGHNPDFESILQELTQNKTAIMPTSALAILNFNVKSWHDLKHSNCKLADLILPVKASDKTVK